MKSFDIDVERTVLGDLIAFETLQDDTPNIESTDFAYAEHQSLFEVMKELYDLYGKYDYLSVATAAKDDVKQILFECTAGAVSSATYTEHKKLLKEMASVRRLNKGVERLQLNGDMCVANLEKLLSEEGDRRLCVDLKKQNYAKVTNFITEIFNKDELLSTGFPLLDKTIGGLRKGTLFTVGARPSTGKTTFALNVAKNVYKAGKKVVFFSLEMTSNMIYERLFADWLGIDYNKFVSKEIPFEKVEKIGEILNETKERLFIIDDVYCAEQMCNIVLEERPDLVIIDFMQVISTTEKHIDMRTKIDYISALLKRTAKNTGTVVLVLSQLSRAGKDSPTMSDLKESGGLEQDGDYIALLHRPYVLKKDLDESPGATFLLLDKNKFGATGKINLNFDLNHQRFTEVYDR